jgi:hypothetical protein
MTEESGSEHAQRLKERVYITFTALAVVLALREHGASADEAAVTLTISLTGTLLAVLVADVVSHIAVYAVLPTQAELRLMIRVSFGTLGALIVPLVFVALAVVDRWPVTTALRAATIALIVALGVIGYLAVRRVRLPVWQKVIVLLAEFALGICVVGLEWLAHGL